MPTEEGFIEKEAIENFDVRDEVSFKLMQTIRTTVNYLRHRYKSSFYDSHDFAQEIWIRLVSNDGRLLKQYDSKRGMSFASYIRMITEREMFNILRKEYAETRERNHSVGFDDSWNALSSPVALDTALEARNLEQKLHDWLCHRLSDRGIEVLHAIYYQGYAAPDAALRLGLSTQVIYNWQHKIRTMSREFLSSERYRLPPQN